MKGIFTKLLVFHLFIGTSIAWAQVDYVSSTADYDPSGGGLTDQEQDMADNYIHTGLVDRKYNELCEGTDVCDKNPDSVKSNQKVIADTVANMLAIFGMSGSSKISDTKFTKGGEEHDGVDDYCAYIPTATQAAAQIHQMTSQNDIQDQIAALEKETKVRQKESLYALSRAHDERAKTANMERIGWGSTATCYAAMITYSLGMDTGAAKGGAQGAAEGAKDADGNGISINKSAYVRLATATWLAKFYNDKYSAHRGYSKEAKKIAEQIPGKGECNPLTERQCYCAQEETKNDPTYCLPSAYAANAAGLPPGTSIVSCVDSNFKADPACNCAKTKTCSNAKLENGFNSTGINPAFFGSSMTPLYDMLNGKLAAGKSDAIYNSQNAFNTKAAKKFASKVPVTKRALTAPQKVVAKKLKDMGMPIQYAASLATTKPTAKALNKAKTFKDIKKSALAAVAPNAAISYDADVAGATSTGQLFNKAKKAKKSSKYKFNFGKKKQQAKAKTGVEYMRFAEMAQSKAQITRDNGRPIFEIISSRYKRSGWNKLGLMEQ